MRLRQPAACPPRSCGARSRGGMAGHRVTSLQETAPDLHLLIITGQQGRPHGTRACAAGSGLHQDLHHVVQLCLLYTSDAADDTCVV